MTRISPNKSLPPASESSFTEGMGYVDVQTLRKIYEALSQSEDREDSQLAKWIKRHYLYEPFPPYEDGRIIESPNCLRNLYLAYDRVRMLTNRVQDKWPFFNENWKEMNVTSVRRVAQSETRSMAEEQSTPMIDENATSSPVDIQPSTHDDVKEGAMMTPESAQLATENNLGQGLENVTQQHTSTSSRSTTKDGLQSGPAKVAAESDPVFTNLDSRPSELAKRKRAAAAPKAPTKRGRGRGRGGRQSRGSTRKPVTRASIDDSDANDGEEGAFPDDKSDGIITILQMRKELKRSDKRQLSSRTKLAVPSHEAESDEEESEVEAGNLGPTLPTPKSRQTRKTSHVASTRGTRSSAASTRKAQNSTVRPTNKSEIEFIACVPSATGAREVTIPITSLHDVDSLKLQLTKYTEWKDGKGANITLSFSDWSGIFQVGLQNSGADIA